MRHGRSWWAGVAVAAALAPLANAQLQRPLGTVTGALPPVGETVGDTVNRTIGDTVSAAGRTTGELVRPLDPRALLQDRAQRLADFARRNARVIETDSAGNPVVRGEVLAIAPTPRSLAAAAAAGFTLTRTTTLGELGIEVDVLAPPVGLSATAALGRLRQVDPEGAYELNHIYFRAGMSAAARVVDGGPPLEGAADVRVGLIDTGVAARSPVLQGARIEQRGFAPGAPEAAAHGTATASLIAGRLGRFRGAAPGAGLYVADIYGATATGGSAESLALALDWMAKVGAPVINVSLVGPPNALVAAAVRTLSARGARIVAAVGNDGPAAPPAYPASYPDVVAVTGVDERNHVLPEAGRAAHVDFAAPADGFSAASIRGGLTPVRGTSFAAPIVAGRLARLLRAPDAAKAQEAVLALAREARPIGPVAGHGVIGEDVRQADRQAR